MVTNRPNYLHLLLAAAISMATYNKTLNTAQLLWFGGQGVFSGYQSLKQPGWRPKELFRVISLGERPPPNNVAAMYGLESFDGQLSLNLRDWADFWSAVVWQHPSHIQTGRPGLYWEYWNGQSYQIEDHLKLEFLALANVRFILSALPLNSNRLKLISGPMPSRETLLRPRNFSSIGEFFVYRIRRIFDPGDVYIYELAESISRVQAARTVVFVSDDVSPRSRLQRLVDEGANGIAVASESLRSLMSPSPNMEVREVRQIVDGLSIVVDAPQGGFLIVNYIYLPFWEAWAKNQKLAVFPVNQIHFAVKIPPQTKDVTVIYRRPLLREKIGALTNLAR